MSDLSATLKMLRNRSGLSQTELAERAGLHRNTVCRIELHPERASLEDLDRMLEILGTPMWKVLRHAQRPPQLHQNL